jgi:hypothetical protein
MRKVDIYIEVIADSNNYEKLELFNDEEIQINSSIQNIQDLAKVYTDFTQSFTIPASPHNNRLFEHFYQTDVDAENNPNIRRNAFIEIGTIPFRSGKMSIESSNVVKGRVESYSVTFYGDLTSLKDKFGDDSLKDLDLRSYGHVYNGEIVRTKLVNATDSDIRYPLISSDRQWTYGIGASTDIDTNGGAIYYNELFPALRVKRIFEAIQTKYNVSFDSLFFNQKVFTDLYLWLKNAKTFEALSETQNISFTGIVGARIYSTYMDLLNASGIGVTSSFTSGTAGMKIYVDAVLNGQVVKTTEIKSGSATSVFSSSLLLGANKLEFKVRSVIGGTAIVYFTLGYRNYNPNTGAEGNRQSETGNSGTITLSNPYIDPSVYAPNIKISDFVSGIFKMFNLTCYAKSVDNFQVEPLDDWYTRGAVVDITEYVDTDEIIIERHKLYKEISFDYEKSESFNNKEYFNEKNNTIREFGNVKQSFSEYDGGEYKIEVPFENIYFTKEVLTNTAEPTYAHLLSEKTSVDSYDNKPILLYLDGLKTGVSFYFNNGVTTSLRTQYMPLCNQITYNNALYSNHFSVEGSAFDGTQIDNSLYQMYYAPYLQNLFNRKNRITNVKALFPISLLTSLKLNDRLIIRDKRYIINEMKVNLTTGDVDLALINDFRPVANVNIPQQSALESVVEVPLFPKGFQTFSYQTVIPLSGLVTATTSTDEDTLIDITIPANTTGLPIEWPITRDGEPYATIYQDA